MLLDAEANYIGKIAFEAVACFEFDAALVIYKEYHQAVVLFVVPGFPGTEYFMGYVFWDLAADGFEQYNGYLGTAGAVEAIEQQVQGLFGSGGNELIRIGNVMTLSHGIGDPGNAEALRGSNVAG